MKCKIDHDDAENLPRFLCRTCNPVKAAPKVTEEWPPEEASDAGPRPIAKSRLRRLRAEERRLSDLIDDIGSRDPARLKKLYSAIKAVEGDIDRTLNGPKDAAAVA